MSFLIRVDVDFDERRKKPLAEKEEKQGKYSFIHGVQKCKGKNPMA